MGQAELARDLWRPKYKTSDAIVIENRAQIHPTHKGVSSVQHGSTELTTIDLQELQDRRSKILYKTTFLICALTREERLARGSLVDGGANTGLAGADTRPYRKYNIWLDVNGIARNQLEGLQLCDCAARGMTTKGPVIFLMGSYAYHGEDRTIHSKGQMEHFGLKVDDKSMKVGGTQCIKTPEGYIIPLDIINGLAYLKLEPFTDEDWSTLPHLHLTATTPWNPKLLDNVLTEQEEWPHILTEMDQGLMRTPFDEFGNYKDREPVYVVDINDDDKPSDKDYVESNESDDDSTLEYDTDEDLDLDALLGLPDYGEQPDGEMHSTEQGERYLRNCFRAASDMNVGYFLALDQMDPSEVDDIRSARQAMETEATPKSIDYEKYRPYFLHVPKEKVKKTFDATTRYATNVMSGKNIIQTTQSPYPALNVPRRNEPVATDTVYAETPAVASGGCNRAQIFVGRKSLVIDVYGMSSDAQFVNTLEDNIRQRGAMDTLISDSARVEISERVKTILRALYIKDWQSEPNYQHQNFAEHRYRHLKRNLQWYMNYRNVDPEAWLLCLQWVADVMNHTAERSLGWRPPLEVLTGQTIDISIMLIFMFWDVVYVARYKDKEYSGQLGTKKSNEIRGRFVGFAWNVGHALTFKILTDDTKKIITRSRVRLAATGENNLKLDLEAGAVPNRVYIKSSLDENENSKEIRLPTIDIGLEPFQVDYQGTDAVNTVPTEAKRSVPEEPPVVETVTEGTDPKVPDSDAEELFPQREEQETEQEKNTDDMTSNDKTHPTDDEEVPDLIHRSGELSDDEDSDDEDDDEWGATPVPQYHKRVEESSTCESELDKPTPMDRGKLKDAPIVDTVDEDEDLAPHLKGRAPGEPNPLETPIDMKLLEELWTNNPTQPGLPPEELPGRSFLMPPEENGDRYRAKILEKIKLSKEEREKDPDMIKFRCRVGDKYDEIVAYSDIVDFIEQDDGWDGVWKYKRIIRHIPVKPKDPLYKGCSINLQLEWETGEITQEPLHTRDKTGVWNTDPVSVAIYVEENNLQDTKGFKLPGMKRLMKTKKRIIRQANQAKMRSYRITPVWKYGYLVPKDYHQAMELDRRNGDNKWQEAIDKEFAQVDEYDTFIDKGFNWDPGKGYTKITVHLVFDVKHDGRHKARLVAGGHLTPVPLESVYSSVVSLRGIRLLAFIAENNQMDLWATDIGNAYLESHTQEKVYIKAGPEFGDRAGHYLVIDKALYGLKTSGLRWHERLADVLRAEGYFISRAEQDIWMKDMGDHYEYIAVYVDDLLIASRDPQKVIDMLKDKNKFKLKGTGPIEFHLGCDFFRDRDGVLCMAPKKYIDKCVGNYERMFGEKPKKAASPLVKGDHPELDTSDLLDTAGQKTYQSLIGSLQWAIQIGRFDVATATMTMSRFRAAPRQGHLDRVKRIIGYLYKMKHGIIRFRTEEPDFSMLEKKEYDWCYTCYGGAQEELPEDAPRALGARVFLSSYVDANLYHDLISGKAVTGILHFLNKTPIDWYTKLQSTVETATFGSEYIAAKTCTEQLIDLRNTLRYLGVHVEGPSYMFGDNKTVVDTASVPAGKLHKRHNALAYHKTRYAIAADIIRFYHISGETNPADILSKHWDYASVWSQLKPLLFWIGDTAELDEKGNLIVAGNEEESGKPDSKPDKEDGKKSSSS